ncbi:CoA-binding protein [Halalkalicoccus salilacus]
MADIADEAIEHDDVEVIWLQLEVHDAIARAEALSCGSSGTDR